MKLVVGLLALRGNAFSKSLAYLWIIGALAYFMALTSSVLPVLFLSGIGIAISGLGTNLGPFGMAG